MDPVSFSAVVAAMVAAITALWKKQMMDKAVQDKKHEKCEEENGKLQNGMHDLEKRVAVFEACPSEPCGARDAFTRQQTFSINRKEKHE